MKITNSVARKLKVRRIPDRSVAGSILIRELAKEIRVLLGLVRR